MNALNLKDFEGNDVMKPVREKLLGKSALDKAPQMYWDTLLYLELGYMPQQWREMSLWDKATIIAARVVKNMIDIINAYYDEMEERLKNKGKKDGN